MNKMLTNKQKSVLSQLASKAYKAMTDKGDMGICDLTEWRRDAQYAIVGVESLTEMTQEHYVQVYNHFARLAGVKQIEDKTWSKKAKAIYLLEQAMQKQELGISYLATVVKDKFPHACTLLDGGYMTNWKQITTTLSADELMQLVYTINNRGRMKTRNINATKQI